MPPGRTIAFVSVPLHGHINPTLPVVAELVRRGHHVTYHSLPEFDDAIAATGATVLPYPDVATPPDRLSPVTALEWVTRVSLDLVPVVAEDLRRTGADLVVHDAGCLWGAVAARHLGIPAAAFYTTFALNRHVLSATAAAGLLLPTALRRPGLVAGFLRARRELSRRFDAPGVPRFDMANISEPLNLVFTSREFQVAAGTFGPGHRFVGPSLGARPPVPDFPLDGLRDPVVYLSLGTVFSGDAGLLRGMMDALAPIAGTLVLATGRTDPAELGARPANVLAARTVPQLDVLDRAALFVTHGGMNSVNEALDAGVPMLVRPIEADQPLVAARVAELGAGLVLAPAADPRTVREQALRVLDEPRFRAVAEHLRTAQRAAGGYHRAADELERALTPAGSVRTA